MIGTRVGVTSLLECYEFQCSRCGIRRTFKVGRPRPDLCADCKYVLTYRPEQERPEWTVDAMRTAHAAYVKGLRDAETVQGQRAYERDRAKRRREAMTPEQEAAETARLAAVKAARGVKVCPVCGQTRAAPNMPRHIRTHPGENS